MGKGMGQRRRPQARGGLVRLPGVLWVRRRHGGGGGGLWAPPPREVRGGPKADCPLVHRQWGLSAPVRGLPLVAAGAHLVPRRLRPSDRRLQPFGGGEHLAPAQAVHLASLRQAVSAPALAVSALAARLGSLLQAVRLARRKRVDSGAALAAAALMPPSPPRLPIAARALGGSMPSTPHSTPRAWNSLARYRLVRPSRLLHPRLQPGVHLEALHLLPWTFWYCLVRPSGGVRGGLGCRRQKRD